MRSKIENRADGLTFVIPPARPWFVMIFLPVWLVGWAFGEAFAIRQLRSDPAEPWFLVFWLVGWTIGGASAALTVAWMIAGRERLEVRPDALSHRREILGVGWTNSYPLSQVRSLRVAAEPAESDRSSSTSGTFGLGKGVLSFDCGAKTVRLAAGVDEAEGKMIVKRILSRYSIPGSVA